MLVYGRLQNLFDRDSADITVFSEILKPDQS